MNRNIYPPDYVFNIEKIIAILRNNDGVNSGLDADKLKGFTYDKLLSNTELFNQLSALISESYTAPIIKQPVISFPPNGYEDFVNTPIVLNNYYTIDSFDGPHTATSWQIATDDQFNDIVEESLVDNLNPLSFSPQNLEDETNYFVRVKFHSFFHYSEWSDIVAFKTGLKPAIETPAISLSGYPDAVPIIPTVICSIFKVINDFDIHISTDWIVEDSNGVTIWSEIDSVNNLTTITFPSDFLTKDTSYKLKVRYKGNTYLSDWGELAFTVTSDNGIIAPLLFIDGWPNDIGLTPTFSGGSFITSGLNIAHESTEIVIKDFNQNVVWSHSTTVNPKTIFTVPVGVLYLNSIFYLEMRYLGANLSSGWSILEFTPSELNSISTPDLIIENANPLIPLNPVLKASGFNTPTGTEYHRSTDWSILDRYDRVIWSSLNDEQHLTEITVTDAPLIPNEEYIFKVKYNSDNETSGTGFIYGVIDNFTIIDTPILYVENETNVLPDEGIPGGPLLMGSQFTSSAPNDFHRATDWQVLATDNTVIWESLNDAVNLVKIYIPAGTLSNGGTFKFRVRYIGNVYYSDWVEKELTTYISYLSDYWYSIPHNQDIRLSRADAIMISDESLFIHGVDPASLPTINKKYFIYYPIDGYSTDISTLSNGPNVLNAGLTNLPNNTIILYGGEDQPSGQLLDGFSLFNFATLTWETFVQTNRPNKNARLGHIGNNKICVFGGEVNATTRDYFILNTSNNSIENVSPHPQNAKYFGLTVLGNNDLLVVGGVDLNGALINNCYIFNVSTGLWIHVANYPLNVYNPSMVTLNTGNVLSVSGVNQINNYINNVYEFTLDGETNGLPGQWLVREDLPNINDGNKTIKLPNGRLMNLFDNSNLPSYRSNSYIYSY